MAAAAGDKTDWDSVTFPLGSEQQEFLLLAALLDAGLTRLSLVTEVCWPPRCALKNVAFTSLQRPRWKRQKPSCGQQCSFRCSLTICESSIVHVHLIADNTWICELFFQLTSWCVCASWVTWSYLSGAAPCHRCPLAKSACVRWLCHCDLASVRGCRATHWHSRLQACLPACLAKNRYVKRQALSSLFFFFPSFSHAQFVWTGRGWRGRSVSAPDGKKRG